MRRDPPGWLFAGTAIWFYKIHALALKLGCPQVQLAGVNPAWGTVAAQAFCLPGVCSASLRNSLGPVCREGSAFQCNSEPFPPPPFPSKKIILFIPLFLPVEVIDSGCGRWWRTNQTEPLNCFSSFATWAFQCSHQRSQSCHLSLPCV